MMMSALGQHIFLVFFVVVVDDTYHRLPVCRSSCRYNDTGRGHIEPGDYYTRHRDYNDRSAAPSPLQHTTLQLQQLAVVV